MPQVVAGAVLAGVVSGSTIGATLALGFSTSAFFGSLVLGGLNYALSPKPKKPSSVQQITSNTFAVRQSDETHKHHYGHTRAGGVYAHMTTVGEGVNSKLHVFTVYSASEWDSVEEIWANDVCIPVSYLDADGNVTQGQYKDKLRIRIHLGGPNQEADEKAVAEVPNWTVNHRGRGRFYVYYTLTKDSDVYPTGVPNFSVVGRARKIYDPRTTTTAFSTNIALIAYDYLSLCNFGFRAESNTVNETNIIAQANICDEYVNTPALDMTVASIDTASDILTLSTDTNLLQFQHGDRVEVVTTGTAPAGLATATSYYVIVDQTRDTPRIRLATSLTNANQKVAIDITDAGTGTHTIRKTGEPRYHGGGMVDTADEMGNILNDIVNSMAGRAVHVGEKWNIYAGAWRAPVLDLGIGDLRGDGFTFAQPVEMAEKFNVISGRYISSVNNYQPTDYPPVKYQQFIDDDGGIEYPPRQLQLPFTPRATTAQRIAKIELFKAQQGIVVTAQSSMKAYEAQPGDNITLTIDAMGWDAKEFEITQMGLSVQNNALVLDLTLRETVDTIFDWTSGEAVTYDPAPNTNLPNPFVVQVPTGVAFSSRSITTVDGDTIYNLVLSWDAHENAFVTDRGQFDIEFKKSAEATWRTFPPVDGQATFADIVATSINTQYDLRIRAVNSLGRRSNWVTIANASAGSSGGVSTTDDWGSVADSVGTSYDWGAVNDTVGTTNDWGTVV